MLFHSNKQEVPASLELFAKYFRIHFALRSLRRCKIASTSSITKTNPPTDTPAPRPAGAAVLRPNEHEF